MRHMFRLGWAVLAVGWTFLQCTLPCSAGSVAAAIDPVSGIASITGAIASLLQGSGKNLRSVMSVAGCLDGGFYPYDGHPKDVGINGWTDTYRCTDFWLPASFTVGYWPTCPGNTPWQLWQLTEGKLYCSMGVKGWWAYRCIDAFSVRERRETIACNYGCWGGANQEMVVKFGGRAVDTNQHEAAFNIKPRLAQDKCLTYMGDYTPVRFRPCTGGDDQLWFIPGELPLP